MVKRGRVNDLLNQSPAPPEQTSFLEAPTNPMAPMKVKTEPDPEPVHPVRVVYPEGEEGETVLIQMSTHGDFSDFDKLFPPTPIPGVTLPPDHRTIDPMPTVVGRNEKLAEKPKSYVVTDDIVDPREDIEEDTIYWYQLLRYLYAVSGNQSDGLYGMMHALRCLDAVRLEPNPQGGVKVVAKNNTLWLPVREEFVKDKNKGATFSTLLKQVIA